MDELQAVDVLLLRLATICKSLLRNCLLYHITDRNLSRCELIKECVSHSCYSLETVQGHYSGTVPLKDRNHSVAEYQELPEKDSSEGGEP